MRKHSIELCIYNFSFSPKHKARKCMKTFFLFFSYFLFSNSGRLNSRSEKPGGPPTTSLLAGIRSKDHNRIEKYFQFCISFNYIFFEYRKLYDRY